MPSRKLFRYGRRIRLGLPATRQGGQRKISELLIVLGFQEAIQLPCLV